MKQSKLSFLNFILFIAVLAGGIYLLNYYKNEFIDNVQFASAAEPGRFSGSPSGYQIPGTTNITMSVDTDLVSNCRYSTTPDDAFADMTPFTNSSGVNHDTSLTVGDGTSYNYYVKCQEISTLDINSDDYVISFLVGKDINYDNNVFGWAWNDLIGWISFNANDCDTDENSYVDIACGGNNTSSSIPAACDINGNGFVGPECSGDDTTDRYVPYGVNISEDGTMTGLAWSESVGYIKFDAPGPYPVGDGSASLDVLTKEFSGWARVCSMADDPANCSEGDRGWIAIGTTTGTYSLTLDKSNTFKGYAWSDDFGWISFGSNNCDADHDGESDGGGSCPAAGTPIPDYRVGVLSNVTGYAWNDAYGWISFNCRNSGAGGCGGTLYGVNIDSATANVGGYAWSSNLGWISFEEKDLGDYGFVSNCLSPATCTAGNNCTACFKDDTLYGWAKILSLGDDGWIRLDDDNPGAIPTGDGFDYGVTLNSSDDFEGFAWSGTSDNTGIGWISFNCNEGGGPGISICNLPIFDYKVSYSSYFNSRPEATNLMAPNWSWDQACVNEYALTANLKWSISDPDFGSSIEAYKIKVIKDSDGSTVLETPKCIGYHACNSTDPLCTGDPNNYTNCKINLSLNYGNGDSMIYNLNSGDLEYDTKYQWEVTIWDNQDSMSAPVAYFKTEDDPIEADDGDDDTFRTYAHEFPNPNDFTWFAPDPSADESVLFVSQDRAKYYTSNLASGSGCDETKCSWDWHFISGTTGTIANSNASSTIVVFDTKGDQSIELILTDTQDAYNYQCSTSTGIKVKNKLPIWIEGN